MELLGDVGHFNSSFGPFGDGVSVGAKFVARLAPNIPLAQESFWTHPMVLLGDEAQLDARFGPLEIVLILTQDGWMVCAKCTISSVVILDRPDGTPR